jgi:anti-sigma B factor antagonist/stage II sporulation protein AA (anti-sigma F factor antagonist)
MTCDRIVLGGALVMAPKDERIDLSNADAFTNALLAALTQASGVMIVDLSRVDYISSAGLRSLMIALKAAKAEQKSLAVAALRPLTREIFAISRFDIVFSLYDSVRDAIVGLAPDAVAEFDAL